jgi:hypothetical protein
MEKSPSLIGKSSINGPFSIAVLNYHKLPKGNAFKKRGEVFERTVSSQTSWIADG